MIGLLLKEANVNLSHIESRPDLNDKEKYDFLVTCDAKDKDAIAKVFEKLKTESDYYHVLSHNVDEQNDKDICKGAGFLLFCSVVKISFFFQVHWFPKHIRELDQFANRILSYGSELDSDHPVYLLFLFDGRKFFILSAALLQFKGLHRSGIQREAKAVC